MRRASGRVQLVDRATGVPLGLVAGERYEEVGLRLGPEDALVLVTDGITDPLATDGDPLGEAALARLLERAPRLSLGMCEALLVDGVAHARRRDGPGGAAARAGRGAERGLTRGGSARS